MTRTNGRTKKHINHCPNRPWRTQSVSVSMSHHSGSTKRDQPIWLTLSLSLPGRSNCIHWKLTWKMTSLFWRKEKGTHALSSFFPFAREREEREREREGEKRRSLCQKTKRVRPMMDWWTLHKPRKKEILVNEWITPKICKNINRKKYRQTCDMYLSHFAFKCQNSLLQIRANFFPFHSPSVHYSKPFIQSVICIVRSTHWRVTTHNHRSPLLNFHSAKGKKSNGSDNLTLSARTATVKHSLWQTFDNNARVVNLIFYFFCFFGYVSVLYLNSKTNGYFLFSSLPLLYLKWVIPGHLTPVRIGCRALMMIGKPQSAGAIIPHR